MARVQIYNGYSAVVPILFKPANTKNTLDLNIKIKEEPPDLVEGKDNDEVKKFDKLEITCDTRLNHRGVKLSPSLGSGKPKVICTTAGLSPTNFKSTKKSINNKISNVDSEKSLSEDFNCKTNGISNGSSQIRLRMRTPSCSIECEICHVEFRDIIAYKLHKSRYSEHKLVCHICRLCFISPIHLLSHRRLAHINRSRYKYECQYCKLQFRHKCTLQMHIFHDHNLSKLSNKKLPNRLTNGYTNLTKNSLNFKSQNKRKRKNSISDPLQKKLIINSKREEITIETPNKKKIKVENELIPNPQIVDNMPLNALQKPPLVKICAIPNELEALLNDCGDENDDSSSVFSDNSASDSSMNEIRNDLVTKKYSLRSSNRFFQVSSPKRFTQRKLALLLKRHNCRDCRVHLERLSLSFQSDDNDEATDFTNTEKFESAQSNFRPTIGMELKNLDLALKKLQGKHDNELIAVDKSEDPINDSIKSSMQPVNEVISTIVIPPPQNRILYTSSLCQTRFTTEKKLVFHYLCYHTDPHYKECAVCRLQFDNITLLTKHMTYHCIEIPESSAEKSPINPQGPCENSREKYMCRACKEKFWMVSSLRLHEKNCLPLKILEEKESSKNNSVKNFLTEPPNAKAPVSSAHTTATNDLNCGSKLAETYIFKSVTLDEDQSELSHRCHLCRVEFKSASLLHEHKKKYTLRKTKSYCGCCGTPFPSPSLLSSHTKSAHSPVISGSKIYCIICTQAFHTKKVLQQHIMHIHNEELKDTVTDQILQAWRIHKTCSVCKTIFSDRKRFIEHSMYYYDDDIIECTICHEKFSGQYKAHSHTKKVHYSEEMRKGYSYCCSICNEGFVYPSHLYSHMYHVHDTDMQQNQIMLINEDETNNIEKPFYSCRICHETFESPLLLANHEEEYSNNGGYSCIKCNRKFTKLSFLQNHIQLTHNTEFHSDHIKCHSCFEVLPSKSAWLSHVKHFHIIPTENVNSTETLPDHDYSLCKLSMPSDANANLDANFISHLGLDKSIEMIYESENNEDQRTSSPIRIEYTCALCDMKFMNREDLKIHSLNYGNTCIYKNSEAVNTDFSIASIYSVELEDYEKLCSEKCDSINEIKIKKQKPEEIKNENEDAQMDIIENSRELRNLQEDNYICKICLCNFSTRKSYTKHMRLYSNTGDYECKLCHRKFENFATYNTHMIKHKNRTRDISIPTYYCKTCDEKFVSENSKKSHFSHIHGASSELPKSNNISRRVSVRQQSKLLYQTNLNSFITRGTTEKILKNSNEINDKIVMNHGAAHKKKSIDSSTTDINPNTLTPISAQKINFRNAQEDCSGSEYFKDNSNSSSAITLEQLENNAYKEMKKFVKMENDVAEKETNVITERNETLNKEKEVIEAENNIENKQSEIIVEREEIVETEVSICEDSTVALCDICGDVLTDGNDLDIHQRTVHNIGGKVGASSDINKEFIDVEVMNEDIDSETNDDCINDDTSFNGSISQTEKKSFPAKQLTQIGKYFSAKGILECKICHKNFLGLKALVKHLKQRHQSDLFQKTNRVQNSQVSSSSKMISNPETEADNKAKLSCKLCGKQFTNNQYLFTHMKNVHASILNIKFCEKQNKIIIAHPVRSSIAQSGSLSPENFTRVESLRLSMQDGKPLTRMKDSLITIEKISDKAKNMNEGIILKKLLMTRNPDLTQNPINQNTSRFSRLIPIPKNTLIRSSHRLILPKPN